jgi:hypothetical protein
MKSIKKTEKIPCLPVLAGLMILIMVILAAGCTANQPAIFMTCV